MRHAGEHCSALLDMPFDALLHIDEGLPRIPHLACTARLEELVALASGVRAAVENGRVTLVVSPPFVEAMRVAGLRLRDYRFRGHEALYALDGDGDGIDDLATRGYGPFLGGTSVLRIVDGKKPKDPRRLERMATGFAWESR